MNTKGKVVFVGLDAHPRPHWWFLAADDGRDVPETEGQFLRSLPISVEEFLKKLVSGSTESVLAK
jgi:hypothetical protein